MMKEDWSKRRAAQRARKASAKPMDVDAAPGGREGGSGVGKGLVVESSELGAPSGLGGEPGLAPVVLPGPARAPPAEPDVVVAPCLAAPTVASSAAPASPSCSAAAKARVDEREFELLSLALCTHCPEIVHDLTPELFHSVHEAIGRAAALRHCSPAEVIAGLTGASIREFIPG